MKINKKRLLLSLSAVLFIAGCDTVTDNPVKVINGDSNTTFTDTEIKGAVTVSKRDYDPDTETVTITGASVNMCDIKSFTGSSVSVDIGNPSKEATFDILLNGKCYSNKGKLLLKSEVQTKSNGTYDNNDIIYFINPEYSQKNVYSNKGTDPVFYYQWYLNNYGQNLYPVATETIKAGEDIDVKPVWNQGITGKDTKIAIIDNGVDIFHPDLNISKKLSFNYYNNTPNTTPYGLRNPNASHATMIAGIIGGQSNNGIGIKGIASDADIISFNPVNDDLQNMFYSSGETNLTSQAETEFGYFLNALTRNITQIDIYNNSWDGDTTTLSSLLNSHINELDKTVLQGILNGRAGKGAVYIKSSGNDGNNADSNFLQIQSNPNLIVVGSVTGNGVLTPSTSTGSNVLISAYGGDTDTGIVTTDLAGKNRGADYLSNTDTHFNVLGNENDDYTDKAVGSDFAAAEVSGVVALMLQANPFVTYRDIKIILAKTARQNDVTDNDWKLNGAGLHFNNKYGFGVIDASNAVKMASDFQSVGSYKDVISDEISKDIDKNTTDGEMTIPVYIDKNINVEDVILHITLDTNINNTYRYQTFSKKGTNDNNSTYDLMQGNNILEINTTAPITFTVYDNLDKSVYSLNVASKDIQTFPISKTDTYRVEITKSKSVSNNNNNGTTTNTNSSQDVNWSYTIKSPYPSVKASDIEISITSPQGTADTIVKAPNSLKLSDKYNNTRLLDEHFLNEQAQGVWYIHIKSVNQKEFEVKNVSLKVQGH